MSQITKLIAIDHGNRKIKSCSFPHGENDFEKLNKLKRTIFSASFMDGSLMAGINGFSTTLEYGGREYIHTEHLMPEKDDKTVDDDYFALTLMAVGKELAADDACAKLDCPDVELLVGLPPQHFKEMKPRFEKYFRCGERVSFRLDNRTVAVKFTGVYVYVQAFCAAITVSNRFSDYSTVNIADIGGNTADCFPLEVQVFRPDMQRCKSLKFGMNMLFGRINDEIRSKILRNDLDCSTVEKILMKDPRTLNGIPQMWVDLVDQSGHRIDAVSYGVCGRRFDCIT
jgi:hypothetical protein